MSWQEAGPRIAHNLDGTINAWVYSPDPSPGFLDGRYSRAVGIAAAPAKEHATPSVWRTSRRTASRSACSC